MTLVRHVSIPANDRRGELAGLLYEIESGEWQRLRDRRRP
jgi:hypothetical protein